MKFVDSYADVFERCGTKLLIGEAERCMSADQNLSSPRHEADELGDLASISGGGAEVPLVFDHPVGEEAVLGQRCRGERSADRSLGNSDDQLCEALVTELVQADEHQRTALAGRRRRFHEQELSVPMLEDAGLHFAHAHRVRFLARSLVGVMDCNQVGHQAALPLAVSVVLRAA